LVPREERESIKGREGNLIKKKTTTERKRRSLRGGRVQEKEKGKESTKAKWGSRGEETIEKFSNYLRAACGGVVQEKGIHKKRRYRKSKGTKTTNVRNRLNTKKGGVRGKEFREGERNGSSRKLED